MLGMRFPRAAEIDHPPAKERHQITAATGAFHVSGKAFIGVIGGIFLCRAHLFGPEYGELINFFGLAIKLGLAAKQLKSMTAAYPSVGSDLGSLL